MPEGVRAKNKKIRMAECRDGGMPKMAKWRDGGTISPFHVLTTSLEVGLSLSWLYWPDGCWCLGWKVAD